jgi:hypothetical protein
MRGYDQTILSYSGKAQSGSFTVELYGPQRGSAKIRL